MRASVTRLVRWGIVWAAAGCAVSPRYAPAPAGAQELDSTPVRAWLDYPTDRQSLSFTLSRPAYVAIFEVVPGRGARLLYPTRFADGAQFDEGFSRVWMDPLSAAREYYAYDPSDGRFPEPRYIYLIASESPIHAEQFLSRAGSLRSALGGQYAAYSTARTFDEINSLVLEDPTREDWATDMIVLWPQASRRYVYRAQPRLIYCGNGRALLVPWDYPYAVCPGSSPRTSLRPALHPDSLIVRDTTRGRNVAAPPQPPPFSVRPPRAAPAATATGAGAPELLRAGRRAQPLTGLRAAPPRPVAGHPAAAQPVQPVQPVQPARPVSAPPAAAPPTDHAAAAAPPRETPRERRPPSPH